MVREARRVRVESDGDLREVVDAVHADSEPRILERDGEAIAAVVSIEELRRMGLTRPSREAIERALAAAGSWKDLDTEDLKDRIYQNRHAAPPSPPVTFDDSSD